MSLIIFLIAVCSDSATNQDGFHHMSMSIVHVWEAFIKHAEIQDRGNIAATKPTGTISKGCAPKNTDAFPLSFCLLPAAITLTHTHTHTHTHTPTPKPEVLPRTNIHSYRTTSNVSFLISERVLPRNKSFLHDCTDSIFLYPKGR